MSVLIPLIAILVLSFGAITFDGSLSDGKLLFAFDFANFSFNNFFNQIPLLFIGWVSISLIISFFVIWLAKRGGPEYIVGYLATLLTLAVVYNNRLIDVGFAEITAGTLIFCATFFLTDVLSEHWGKKYARKAVRVGLFVIFNFFIVNLLFSGWPSTEGSLEVSQMFDIALGQNGRILFAGFIAFFISQEIDIYLYAYLKRKTRGRKLWLRNNVSTITSQFINSAIFLTLAFYGQFPLFPIFIGSFIVKVFFAILDTPFLYLSYIVLGKGKRRIKRYQVKEQVYDEDDDYEVYEKDDDYEEEFEEVDE